MTSGQKYVNCQVAGKKRKSKKGGLVNGWKVLKKNEAKEEEEEEEEGKLSLSVPCQHFPPPPPPLPLLRGVYIRTGSGGNRHSVEMDQPPTYKDVVVGKENPGVRKSLLLRFLDGEEDKKTLEKDALATAAHLGKGQDEAGSHGSDKRNEPKPGAEGESGDPPKEKIGDEEEQPEFSNGQEEGGIRASQDVDDSKDVKEEEVAVPSLLEADKE